MLNQLHLIGNLGRDPEMTYTPNGAANTKFSLAVSRRYNDANGQRQEHTQWFHVVCWERLAETVNEYAHKGSRVYVCGRIESRDYTDKDGNKRTAWEVTAQQVLLLDPKPADRPQQAGEGGQ